MSTNPSEVLLAGAAAVHDQGVDAIELLCRAATAAVADTGAPSLASAVDLVAVPVGSWRHPNAAAAVAARLGAPQAVTVLADVGVPQQTLVSYAITAIAEGRARVAVVSGSEARRFEAANRAASADSAAGGRGAEAVAPVPSDGWEPSVRFSPTGEVVSPAEIAVKAWEPVQQYAMIDNALRAAEGLSIAAHLAEIDELWAAMSGIAATNPSAAFPRRRSAAELRSGDQGNRPLAFPYRKWHSTQWTVDQAAALVLVSGEVAAAHGVALHRCVVPVVAIESSHAVALCGRDELARWPAMGVLGRSAEAFVGRPLSSVEHIELYSCFPAAVRVQQRELGLLDRVPSVTGGMAFAGGPFNNFTYQATVAMVERLRADPSSAALVSTVSGLLTKPGLALWAGRASALADGRPPLVADLKHEAAAATAVRKVVDPGAAHRGPAVVVTYTVTYDGAVPTDVIAVAVTPEGSRCVVRRTDPHLAAQAERSDLIGAEIAVDATTFTV